MKYGFKPYTLVGAFKTLQPKVYDSRNAAENAAREHAASAGYTNVKFVDTDDNIADRVTATTPGGRHGRNIGEIYPLYDFSGEGL